MSATTINLRCALAGITMIAGAHAADLTAYQKTTTQLGGVVKHINWTGETMNVWLRLTTSPPSPDCEDDGRACAPVGIDSAAEANTYATATMQCFWDGTPGTVYSIRGYGNAVTTGALINDFSCTVTATYENRSETPLTRYLGVYTWNNAGSRYAWPFVTKVTMPAMSVCRATIDNLDFGYVHPDDTVAKALVIDKTASNTSSTVTITGPDLQPDGTLRLGGSSDATVTADSPYVRGASWVSNASVNIIPVTLHVGKGAHGGPLSSNLTATLTCE